MYSFESDFIDTAYMPMSSGCSTIVRIPLAEAKKDNHKAVIGLADIWERPLFDADILAFTVSHKEYERMENDAKDCFFQAETWEGIKKRL